MINEKSDTIVAPVTAPGMGAIAVIRMSGKNTFRICSDICFTKAGKSVSFKDRKTNTLKLYQLKNGDELVDEVLTAVFKAPHSYTGEDVVEISCHGSTYIQQEIISLILSKGARMAEQGEFTLRAFLNGKMDLSQAEAVADLISSNSRYSHDVAIQQMRGGFSNDLKDLRDKLIQFASLIELELDFSQEDVTFADKPQLVKLVKTIRAAIQKLVNSFAVGNVIKLGIPVAIVGKPNSGKSTLLNALLNEERAIVSDIAGTTRDTIEEELMLNGVKFRFIDTAGLRDTVDKIENLGMNRTFQKMKQSSVVIYLFDVHEMTPADLASELKEITEHIDNSATQLILAGNKIDKENSEAIKKEFASFFQKIIFISSKEKQNIEELISQLSRLFDLEKINTEESVVTNTRHLDALIKSNEALEKVAAGLDKDISGELLAADIRQALHYIGLITGEVSSDDLLQSIFSRFCIGK